MTTVGKLFHVTHATSDLVPLDAWYDRVLQPWHGMMEQKYAARVHRIGSLLVVGDAVVETVAPSGPGAEGSAIDRFVERFGTHLHSLAWYSEDVGALFDSLSAAGVRVLGGRDRPTDGDVYTHPRDTGTLLEFYQPPSADGGPTGSGRFLDPRFSSDWPTRWRRTQNALGIDRMAYVTVVVTDLDRSVAIYTEGIGAVLLHETASTLTGTRSTFVAVGPETVVELATPTDDGLARDDLSAYGDICHAVAFHVADLHAARARLVELGIGIAAHDEATILTAPVDTFGAAFRFTTWTVPGDPRS